jgi:hypothetical protein
MDACSRELGGPRSQGMRTTVHAGHVLAQKGPAGAVQLTLCSSSRNGLSLEQTRLPLLLGVEKTAMASAAGTRPNASQHKAVSGSGGTGICQAPQLPTREILCACEARAALCTSHARHDCM